MASSVQSLGVASARPITTRPALAPRRGQGTFASLMRQTPSTEAAHTSAKNSSDKDQITRPKNPGNTQSFEVDQPITGNSIAEVVLQVLGSATGPAESNFLPTAEQQTARVAKDSNVIAKAPDAIADKVTGKSPDAPGFSSTQESDPAPSHDSSILAQPLSGAGEPKALRLGFSSVFFIRPEGSGNDDSSIFRSQALSPAYGAVSGHDIAKPKGDLVFQLSLQMLVADPAKEGDGRAPANEGSETSSKASVEDAPQNLQQALADEAKTASQNREQLPTQEALIVSREEGQEREALAAEVVPAAAHETVREVSMAYQSFATPHSRTDAASQIEQPSPRRATPQGAEIEAPKALQPSATTMLQKIGITVRGTDQFVRLDIRQRMGSVRVSVHSDDAALAARLRDSLPELLNQLDESGLQPRVTSFPAPTNQQFKLDDTNHPGKPPERRWQDPDQQRRKNPQRYRLPANWDVSEL